MLSVGKHRTGYIVFKAASLILLWAFIIPNKKKLQFDNEFVIVFAIIEALASMSFFFLQGSNPGYISEEMVLGTSADNAAEGGLLKMSELSYRQEKIERIEIEISRIQTEISDLSPENAQSENVVVPNTKQNEKSNYPSSTFCSICGFEPPIRSYHCKACNKCVGTFDHHCFIIGTCVGEKNHCRFWWFLFFHSTQVILSLHIIHSAFRTATSRGISYWVKANALPLATATILCLLFVVVFSLLCFHSFLMASNLTTYEVGNGPERLAYLHGTQECDLPFSAGILNNICSFCCLRDGFRKSLGLDWRPTQWKPPGRIIRDSNDILGNIWENKYYSCC